jgi:transposase
LRFAGIDVGGRSHVVAVVDESCAVLVKPTAFTETAEGYARFFSILGSPTDVFVAMEATGHYGRNLCGALAERTFSFAIVNPLRTRRFAEEDLMRAKTDSVDALGIARFAAQKRPRATPVDDLGELRELVRYHNRLLQDLLSRVKQLGRLVRLGYPEFTDHVRCLDSHRATAILRAFPSAAAFTPQRLDELAAVVEGGERPRRLGLKLARPLVETAQRSVGRHHSPAYHAQMRYLCDDIDTLRSRVHGLAGQISGIVHQHPVGSLLLSIDGIGPTSVARILAAAGDPANFRSAAALAAYVGAAPGTRSSGVRWSAHARLSRIGHSRLRRALYMATLSAVQRNAWLGGYYQRLKARGKLPKVALVATMRKMLVAVYSIAKHRRPFVARPTEGSVAQEQLQPSDEEHEAQKTLQGGRRQPLGAEPRAIEAAGQSDGGE